WPVPSALAAGRSERPWRYSRARRACASRLPLGARSPLVGPRAPATQAATREVVATQVAGDAVLAPLLDLAQSLVGAGHQVVCGLGWMPGGQSDRGMQRMRLAARDLEVDVPQPAQRPLARDGCPALLGVGQDDDEFVSAVARHTVEAPELVAQRVGNPAQDPVSHQMPPPVVDQLEVVQIDEKARQPAALAAGATSGRLVAATHATPESARAVIGYGRRTTSRAERV